MIAGAVGADGIGSIRYPAAYCGITGLKPTFRRSTMEGHHIADRTRTIVSGPLCVDAADCRLLAGVLFGEELAAGDAAGLRVGVVDTSVWSDCDPEVSAACEEALVALLGAAGGERIEVELEGLDHSKLASILIGQTEELHAMTPARVAAMGEEVSVVHRALLKYRLLIPGALIERARVVRTLLRRSLAAAFERVDVLAWPTVAAPTPPLENPTVEVPSGPHTADEINPRQCGIANLTGIPAISIPVGVHSRGLPMALQLLAPWGRDELLLDAAEALERATDRQHVEALPPIAAGAPAA
jgi:Asp-tRNA(Asn)/Glu-tRNA(Gln) amidotransferase A subunit family amidase